MTAAVRARARVWLGVCSTQITAFDWFAALFDLCSYQGVGYDLASYPAPLYRLRSRYSSDFRHVAEELDASLAITPPALQEALLALLSGIAEGSGPVRQDELQPALAWLMFLDSLFLGLGSTLRGDSHSPRVLSARLLLAENRSLASSEAPWGLVLPKAATGEYGAGIAKLFDALTRIDLDTIQTTYVPVEDPAGALSTGNLRVAIVAGVQNAEELSWRFFEREGRKVYEVSLAPHAEPVVLQRITNSLALIAERAHIVLLPELISSPRVVDAVAGWLSTSRNSGRHLPLAVLAGTYLDHSDETPPRNTAIVLSGNGERCLSQYKLNPYDLRPDHRLGLSLPGADEVSTYKENISGSPHRAAIADLTGLGRLVVTICEDTARWEPWHRFLLGAGPNLCLAPIMNGQGTRAWEWVIADARKIANEAGASVFVANSGAMLNADGRSQNDYAASAFPRLAGQVRNWSLIDQGDIDEDGLNDWWLYEAPAGSPST